MVDQQNEIKKIKVLRIINRFNLGGPTFNAALLTKYMEPEFSTKLVGGEKDESEADSFFILDQLELTPELIPEMKRSIGFRNDYQAYKHIKKIIKDYQPDIVHTHASKAGAIGRIAAIRCKVPIIVHTFHGNVFKGYFGAFKTAIYKQLERYLAKKSTAIIAISDLQKNELVNEHKICKASKIHVIPLGFDLSKFWTDKEIKRKKFRTRFNISDDEIAIGIVGRLVPIKNHQLFIQSVFTASKKTNQKIRAFIVGDGELYTDLVNYCKQHQIPYSTPENPGKNLITFTSWIKEIDEVNAGIDIAALSSNNEGTPVSLIEAQAAGTPIISTDVGGIRNIVKVGKTAYLTSQNNENEFVESLLKLIESAELRHEFAMHGRSFVEEKFHYNRLVSDMKSLYFDLLNS